MIDVREFEKDPEGVKAKLLRRNNVQNLDSLLDLLKERKALIASLQKKQEHRNEASKTLSTASKEQIDKHRAELKELSDMIKVEEANLKQLEESIDAIILTLPNIPRDDVPEGKDAQDNVVVKHVLKPRDFTFDPQHHVDIGERLGVVDFARAVKISGSRFAFLKGAASQLNRALLQFFCDYHTNKGDTELTPPYLVRANAMLGTGQFPKFKEDVFEVTVTGTESLYLIPTAETSLTNYFADEILDEEQLPIRFCAYSPCFRSEAGAAGRDTRGLIRMHQFEKVEMLRFATPAQANDELEAMVARASDILEQLELPHRIVALCTGDMSAQSEKTYDLEVWLPSHKEYREISSCSVFGTYQARRAKIRYRPTASPQEKAKRPEFVVTLNGSGLPLGRTLVAIMENHQQSDGSIAIPKVLWPYMNGVRKI